MNFNGHVLLTILKWLFILGLFAWVIYRWVKNTDDEHLKKKLIITAVLLPIIVASIFTGIMGAILAPAFGIVIAIIWGPYIGELLAKPLTGAIDGGNQQLEARPLLSITEARRKQGRYPEAVAEVQKQLDRFPNDFQSWLLLAQIQAEDLKDLQAAQASIETILSQPEHTPNNLAHALTRLADWQLKYGHDVEAARRSFERIVELFPNTELAQLAAQRLAHLGTQESFDQARDGHRIPVPHIEGYVGLRDDFAGFKPKTEDPAQMAADYVKHLQEHPQDFEAREKLAQIYAEHYHRLDLAADQLEQLISHPHQPAKQVVHWLNLLADMQVKYADNVTAARQCLQRIVDLYPNHAAAQNARQRMPYLNLELKGKQKSQVVKLGSYEQNIGLKRNWPGKEPPR